MIDFFLFLFRPARTWDIGVWFQVMGGCRIHQFIPFFEPRQNGFQGEHIQKTQRKNDDGYFYGMEQKELWFPCISWKIWELSTSFFAAVGPKGTLRFWPQRRELCWVGWDRGGTDQWSSTKHILSGKLTVCYGKSPSLSSVNPRTKCAMFNSKLSNYQRVWRIHQSLWLFRW